VIKEAIGWSVKKQGTQPIEEYPIEVEVVGYFVRQSYDTTNMAGPWKLIEDMLVEMRILEGDRRKYVRDVLLRGPEQSQRNYDYVECYLIEGSGRFQYVVVE
jgi:hypothetical protein